MDEEMMINIGFSPEPVQGGDITSLSGQKEAMKRESKSRVFILVNQTDTNSSLLSRHNRASFNPFNVQPEGGY